MTGQIFISHITKGDSRGRQLRRCLVEKVRDRGYTAFVDEEDVSAGDMWRSETYRGLAESDGGALLLTPDDCSVFSAVRARRA
jgi:hypothetical protein